MANPRHGYNPLNPLSLHSENEYREEFNALPGANLLGRGVAKIFGRGGAKQTGQVTGSKGFKEFLKKQGKGELAEEGAKTTTDAALKRQLRKQWNDAQIDALVKSTPNPVRSQLIKTGGLVLVGGYGIYSVFGLGEEFVDDYTGANCDDKAIQAGYEEGSEDYENYVLECQGSASNKLMTLGIGVVLVAGLALFLVLRPKGE